MIGVWGPVPLPVIRMARPPLLLAIAADVAVFGIGGDLLSVVVGAALTLANGFAPRRIAFRMMPCRFSKSLCFEVGCSLVCRS